MEDILQILIENCTNERLDQIAYEDEDFCAIDAKLNNALKQYDNLSLSEQAAKEISHVFDMYAAQNARYTAIAYKKGIEDSVQLLKEMGVI